MNYHPIHGLKKKASTIILGTAWFSPDSKKRIFSLLDAYFSMGGNVIDTGRFYNGGKAETVLKEWLQSRIHSCRRTDILIINKACHHYVDTENRHYPKQCRVTPGFITEDLEYSLANMEQDYFDIYLLHRDNPQEPVEGLIDRLEQHRKEGKITAYGVSNWSLERIAAAQAYAREKGYQGLSVNNPAFSLAAVKTPRWAGCVYADPEYIRDPANRDLTLIAWAPQASGYFAGIFGDNPPEDIKKTYFSEENNERRIRCQKLAAERKTSATAIALAYVLNQPQPILASIGARTPAELEEAVSSLSIHLPPQEIKWLALDDRP